MPCSVAHAVALHFYETRSKECHALRAAVIHAGRNLCHDFVHVIALGCTIGAQAFSLPVYVGLLLMRRDAGVHRHALRLHFGWALPLGNTDGVRPNPLTLDFPVSRPAPGGLAGHAHLFRVIKQLHIALLAHPYKDRQGYARIARKSSERFHHTIPAQERARRAAFAYGGACVVRVAATI